MMRTVLSLIAAATTVWLAGCTTTQSSVNRGNNAPLTTQQTVEAVKPDSRTTSGTPRPADILRDVYLLKVFDSAGNEIAQGSGFLSEQKIITNAHVIAGAAWVSIYDDANSLVSTAPYPVYVNVEHDLAILPFPGITRSGLAIDRRRPELGSSVWAYGAPMGLQNTVTAGNVSAYRDMNGMELMQISAPISPGSSGGPVLSTDGKVIAVVAATYQTGQNLNFAIPASLLPSLSSLTSAPQQFPAESDLVQASDDAELNSTQLVALYAAMHAEPLSYGTPVTRRFEKNESNPVGNIRFFKFTGKAGDTVQLAVDTGNGPDVALTLFDATALTDPDAWIEEDDDSGVGLNPLLRVKLQDDGPFFVAAITEKGATGPFTLYSGYIPAEVAMESRWHPIYEDNDVEHYLDLSSVKLPKKDENPLYNNSYRESGSAWIYVLPVPMRPIDIMKNVAKASPEKDESEYLLHILFYCSSRSISLDQTKRLDKGAWVEVPSDSRRKSVTPGTVGEAWYQSICQ